MKKHRKYILGLVVLVIVATLGTIGGMVLADVGSNGVSNTLTLGGNASTNPSTMTLAWVSIEGSAGTGDARTANWVVGTEYTVDLTAQNNTGVTISGIYGKITGWDPAKFHIDYVAGGTRYTLTAANDFCGFWDGTTYYFGPANTGDTYAAGVERPFQFEVKPLAPTSVSISIVLVDDIDATEDPR